MATIRRYSPKREAILTVLRSTRSHPGAEWIYAQLKPQHPDLSLGTVYRNLALFRQSGEAICVGTVDGEERFDANTQPHAHFICEDCGCVADLDDNLMPEVSYSEIRMKYGFLPRMHSITFYGKCAACAGKNSDANS